MTGTAELPIDRPDRESAPSGPVILLVDDEPDILYSVQHLLRRSRLRPRVIPASSGREALKILEREAIDLIVSDFKMPGMDGIEFLVAARALRPGIPRVLFTAYADPELAHRAKAEAGVNAFLSKALDSQQLLRAVEALMGNAAPTGGPPYSKCGARRLQY